MLESNWRLLSYKTANAFHNMAVDEAILEAHLQGLVPPTLRVYGFEPGAISLGHSQSLSEEACKRAYAYGLEIVRRPTGGRAVLHVDELTYSFVGSTVNAGKHGVDALVSVGATPCVAHSEPGGQDANDPDLDRDGRHRVSPLQSHDKRATSVLQACNRELVVTPKLPDAHWAVLSESIIEAYKQICLGLCYGLNELGVELELGETNVPYKHVEDCFLATTGSDLHFQGKKMIGSAQLRRKTAVLQHGSILLNQAQFLMQEILDGKDSLCQSAGLDARRHANLFAVLSESVSIADLQKALANGFARAFGHPFVACGLTNYEKDLVAQLEPKYKDFQQTRNP